MALEVLDTRLTVFLSEEDHAGSRGLHEALLERAREDGMAGATVWRGIEGFGRSGRLRTPRFPDAPTGLPLVVEVIDVQERVDAFLMVVERIAPRAIVTMKSVRMTRHHAGIPLALDDPSPRSPGRQ